MQGPRVHNEGIPRVPAVCDHSAVRRAQALQTEAPTLTQAIAGVLNKLSERS